MMKLKSHLRLTKHLPYSLTTAALSALMFNFTAHADQQILDDLIVVGSICAGQDCNNGESFGFDTIRLKENNLRIKFDDTSNSASFPNFDWQIAINDTGNGGANKFSIDDITSGRTPFTIEGGAPAHSLYVDDGGRIGLGTATPVVELHISNGDTPTLRLEQDGSSGFTPQTWDVAGNETNFFVRDATNGSKLSFRIRPSAPESSIYIDTDGDVGFGTSSPAADLHVLSNNSSVDATIQIDQNGSTGNTWNLGSDTTDGHFYIADYDGSTQPVKITKAAPSNSLFVDASGKVGVGTNTPDSFLDIENNTPSMRLTSTGAGAGVWEIFINKTTGRFNIRDQGSSNIPLKIDPNTNSNLLQLGVSSSDRVDITGSLYINGVDNSTPDYVFKDGYDLLSIDAHATKMWEKSHLPHLTPAISDENGKAIIDVANRSQGVLEELEIAHIYIHQLHKRLNTIEREKIKQNQQADTTINRLQEKLTLLEQRFDKLETK